MRKVHVISQIWADKSTTTYDMIDFISYIKKITRKYLVIDRHILKIQSILLQNLITRYLRVKFFIKLLKSYIS